MTTLVAETPTSFLSGSAAPLVTDDLRIRLALAGKRLIALQLEDGCFDGERVAVLGLQLIAHPAASQAAHSARPGAGEG